MKAIVAALVLVATVLAPTATAGTPSVVNASVCAFHGGSATRPAGSQIIVRQGWASGNLGLVRDFVNAQTTTVSVNGAEAVDVSNLWDTPQPVTGGASSFMSDDTGITLGAGQSLTFHLVATVSHTVIDKEPGGPIEVSGTVMDFTCTVTAV